MVPDSPLWSCVSGIIAAFLEGEDFRNITLGDVQEEVRSKLGAEHTVENEEITKCLDHYLASVASQSSLVAASVRAALRRAAAEVAAEGKATVVATRSSQPVNNASSGGPAKPGPRRQPKSDRLRAQLQAKSSAARLMSPDEDVGPITAASTEAMITAEPSHETEPPAVNDETSPTLEPAELSYNDVEAMRECRITPPLQEFLNIEGSVPPIEVARALVEYCRSNKLELARGKTYKTDSTLKSLLNGRALISGREERVVDTLIKIGLMKV